MTLKILMHGVPIWPIFIQLVFLHGPIQKKLDLQNKLELLLIEILFFCPSKMGDNEPSNPLEEEVIRLRKLVQDQQLIMQAKCREDEDNNSITSHHSDNYNSANDVDLNFETMMKNIVKEPTGETDSSNFDAEIADALADIEKCQDLGPEVTPFIAEAYRKTMERPISKETLERMKNDHKIPLNCKFFQVPKLNPEIWQNLNARGRLSDLKLQQVQNTLSLNLTFLVKISEEITKNTSKIPKDVSTKLLKLALESANVTGTQMQELNKRRRLDVKPFLSQEYHGICTAKVPPSEFLFGDNLADTLKSTKATASVIRSSSNKHRYHPYPSTSQRGSSLNSNRPSNFRGRWNGPNRQYNQNPQFSRQFNQYPQRQSQTKTFPFRKQ